MTPIWLIWQDSHCLCGKGPIILPYSTSLWIYCGTTAGGWVAEGMFFLAWRKEEV